MKKRNFNKGKAITIKEKWRLERKNNKTLPMKNKQAIRNEFCNSYVDTLLKILIQCFNVHIIMKDYKVNKKNEVIDLKNDECDCYSFSLSIFPTIKFGIHLNPICTKGIHWKTEYWLFAEFTELIDKFKPSACYWSKYPHDDLYNFVKDISFILKDEQSYMKAFVESMESTWLDYDYEATTDKEKYDSYFRIKQEKIDYKNKIFEDVISDVRQYTKDNHLVERILINRNQFMSPNIELMFVYWKAEKDVLDIQQEKDYDTFNYKSYGKEYSYTYTIRLCQKVLTNSKTREEYSLDVIESLEEINDMYEYMKKDMINHCTVSAHMIKDGNEIFTKIM